TATGGATGTGGGATGGGTGTGGATGTGGTGGSTGALIHNDVFWKDTSGTPIYSQGGGVFNFNGTYYWYGVKYNGAVTYAANPTKKNSDTSFAAVTCYSSTDLATWKHENDVLTTASLGANVDSATWIGRLGVVYNANTKKYVLISQYQGGPAGTGELFATSDTPTGTFAFDHIQAAVTNVANTTTGDQTIFTDDDGKSYLICSSSSGRSNLYVAPIHAADSLSIDAATRIFGGPGREGNTMFKYNGMYYFCSSDLHGWNASHSYYIAASNIMGPYGAEGVIGNTDADFSHVSQTGFFVTVKGSAGTTVIFAGDRWSDFAGNGLGYNQWCPLTFSGTTPAMASMSEWSFDAAAGTWSVGPDNNYALNPGFEADRVAMTQPAGWTTSTTTSGATPYTNVSGGHTGNWSWQLSSAAAYQATLNQAVSGLPNGTYTLAVWAKSSGGQTTANLYAKGYGGAEKDAALTKAMSGWTQVSITGIAVSNGTCQIGVTTTAGANQSVTLDDFTFIRTGS
ncbi:MAG TPA: family 43 glycosylhydrolase, partial [Polyangia bacterium]|nr:family 43 glycosylhydrolase [Polyangia bacterium]